MLRMLRYVVAFKRRIESSYVSFAALAKWLRFKTVKHRFDFF